MKNPGHSMAKCCTNLYIYISDGVGLQLSTYNFHVQVGMFIDEIVNVPLKKSMRLAQCNPVLSKTNM